MDYQTFNSQQHLPSSFGGSFPTTSAGHLAQPTTHSPQHLYDPQAARLQQSSPSPFPYAQQYTPNGQAGGYVGGVAAGAMMQPGLSHNQNQLHQARAALQQQQQQQQQQPLHQQQPSPSPYSTAPYAQTLASPAHHQFAQNRQTASPSSASNNVSPYATSRAQQPSPSLVPSNANSQQSMNVPSNVPSSQPPTSQSQVQSQSMAQAQTLVKAAPPSPLSPVAQAREKDRMTTLLEINNLLIQEVVELQSQGRAGHIGPTPAEGDKQQPPAKEYVDCMRRLQSNLSFLAQNAEKHNKPNQPIQPGPAIMAMPTSPPELVELYTKLQELYPGWKGQVAQMKASPGPGQRMGSTSQPPNSAGLQNNMNPPNSAGLQNNMQSLGSAGLQQQNMQNMQQQQMSNMNNNIKQQQF